MLRRAGLGVLFLSSMLSCSSSDDGGGGSPTPNPNPKRDPYAPTVFASLSTATLTTEKMFSPKTPPQSSDKGPNPSLPAALDDYLARGFGDLNTGPGESYVTRVIDDSTPPAAGPNAKRLLRFAHLTDLQLSDDESPTRLGTFDSPKATNAALRPQDAYICHMTNACVRTINALSKKDPIAFTLMGGDNADSAQSNEVDWVLSILTGNDRVECDSGDDDDIVDGPDNDGKDPFKAEGFAMPWKWVTGNHDVLIQGNLPVDDAAKDRVLGTDANGGTRFYDNGRKGEVAHGEGVVVADPKRALLDRKGLMAKVAAHGDGHGLGDSEKSSGFATYTFDAADSPFRFLVLDTAHENGASEGVIRQSEVDRVIKPALEKAKADGKWVILASHHAVTSLTDGSGFGSTGAAPGALTQDQWTALVGGYDNVLFSMVGHSHQHRIRAVKPATGHAWWEVMTSAIADYPHQFRVVEIFDQDNGWLMLRATCVDFSVEGDAISAEGKRRGVVDFVSGWLPPNDTQANDRNVEIWIKKPGA